MGRTYVILIRPYPSKPKPELVTSKVLCWGLTDKNIPSTKTLRKHRYTMDYPVVDVCCRTSHLRGESSTPGDLDSYSSVLLSPYAEIALLCIQTLIMYIQYTCSR